MPVSSTKSAKLATISMLPTRVVAMRVLFREIVEFELFRTWFGLIF